MDHSSKSLFQSLVGSSIEFSFKKKMPNVTSIEKNISAAKKNISRDVAIALKTGGTLCVMLLAELTNYYRREVYYMAVRSYIEMRRYRPAVLEYMCLGVEERAEKLKEALSEGLRVDKNRDIKIAALRYFVSVYPSRLVDFKKLLTREEFIVVA